MRRDKIEDLRKIILPSLASMDIKSQLRKVCREAWGLKGFAEVPQHCNLSRLAPTSGRAPRNIGREIIDDCFGSNTREEVFHTDD